MNLKFGNVFASKAVGTGEENDQGAIEHLAIRPRQLPIRDGAFHRHYTGNRFDNESTMWARHADYCDTGRQPPAGQCHNRFTEYHLPHLVNRPSFPNA